MSDGGNENCVRMMAGWIGVEISRSRVRTPGKAGYGLYRVRGSVAHRTRAELAGLIPEAVTADGRAERGPWTPYAFELDQIEANVRRAVRQGTPARPGPMQLVEDISCPAVNGERGQHAVPVRWTPAYRGRRNLGELGAAGHVVDAALGGLDETLREIATKPTVRSRQRVDNAAFQAEHLRRREWGLQQRHARKTSRNSIRRNGQSPMP